MPSTFLRRWDSLSVMSPLTINSAFPDDEHTRILALGTGLKLRTSLKSRTSRFGARPLNLTIRPRCTWASNRRVALRDTQKKKAMAATARTKIMAYVTARIIAELCGMASRLCRWVIWLACLAGLSGWPRWRARRSLSLTMRYYLVNRVRRVVLRTHLTVLWARANRLAQFVWHNSFGTNGMSQGFSN